MFISIPLLATQLTILGSSSPSLLDRVFRLYFSPIFRGVIAYVFNQLINFWAAM
jgi:hypothetical protein